MNESKPTQLKPCPCCKGPAEVIQNVQGGFYVRCEDCWLRSRDEASPTEAITAWNQRSGDATELPSGVAPEEFYESQASAEHDARHTTMTDNTQSDVVELAARAAALRASQAMPRPLPEDSRRHCHKCELPKEVCACADASAYDTWWIKYGRREKQRKEPST